MANRIIARVARVAQQFLRAPFENLPPEYGNTVQPDLRVFEALAEDAQREVREEAAAMPLPYHRKGQARRQESLQRL